MKKVSQLTIKDFETSPIWTWADDDDEDMVISVNNKIQPEDHDSIFVFSEFIFNDGSSRSGFIGIRMYDRHVYILAMADSQGNFIDIPLQPELKSLFDPQKFEDTLGKKMTDVFPLEYSSIFLSFWGTKFEGKVDNVFT